MSSYPPNTPPPPAGPQPPYDPYAWQQQQRVLQQQKAYQQQQKNAWRLQRAQIKAQQRAMRRGSIVGPALLVVIGIVFLLNQTGRLNWGQTFSWYAVWWPGIMITVGCILLGEWAFARQRNGVGGPVLGGGLFVLLLFLAIFGWGMRHLENHHVWGDHFSNGSWTEMMGENHEFDNDLQSAIGSAQPLLIRNPHGDVTVTGSSADDQVHVSVHSRIRAWKDSEAERKNGELMPVFSRDGSQLLLTVPAADGANSDLTVTVPRNTALTIESTKGDISVSELHAPLTLNVNRGDIELDGITGNITMRTDYDDATVSGHSLTGQVELNGRAGDMTFSDVDGGLSLNGDFFGKTHLERVHGITRFQTSRTQFQAARLDGEFEIDGGADLEANQMLGPVILNTHDRNITLDRVAGKVTITNRNGSVSLTNAPPVGGIQITNHKGSVDVGLPSGAGFVVDAQTHNGDLENDFGLKNGGSDDSPMIKGAVNGGGQTVSIVTSDGDVTVRKSTVAPLAPPAPPAKISDAPATPVPPATPKAAHGKKPAPPKPPAAPAAPGGMA